LFLDPLVGGVFLIFALIISLGRLLIGAHYPGDVGAGLLVGAFAAVIVMRLAQPVVRSLVRLAERATDPLLHSLWR
jgi:membrane-associated phospholipid phosphatase